MRQLKPFLPYFFLIVLSASLIYWLFPSHHPLGGIHLPLTADSVLARSQLILRELGVDRTKMSQRNQLKANQKLLQQAEQRYGFAESNSLLRDSIPGYYWEVSWRAPESHNMTFGSSSGGSKDAQAVADFLKGDIYFRFDVAGKVLSFERKIPDSAKISGMTLTDAKNLASTFLTKLAVWYSPNASITLSTTNPLM